MWFVFGLGNPGDEYVKTRHNAGLLALERLAAAKQARFQNAPKLNAHIAKISQTYFIKPDVFMNNSGEVVQKVLRYYAAVDAPTLEQTVVLHDDLDLELGQFKVQFGKGPKVHNGLLSIYQHLHSEAFWHVRIGVDTRAGERSVPPKDYVLQAFTSDEQKVFAQTVTEIEERVGQLIR